jgi:hypothetical protein
MNIRTSTKKPPQSVDDFIEGSKEKINHEQNDLPKFNRGVKMKNLAIPLDVSKRLDEYLKEQNNSSYTKLSANSLIIEAIDSFLKSRKS